MNTQTSIFHALADPARIRIVEAMKSGECAVGDIVERMDIHQSGVSRHLRILAEAGIVQMRPDGQKRLYSLRREAFDQLEAWVAGYRRHWEGGARRVGGAHGPSGDIVITTATPPARARFSLERTYAASIDEAWALWTTKAGIESWWGPEGFDGNVTA